MTEQEKQTEDRIFEAATEVFVDKGLDGARMQDIANRAGINKSLLHYYYRTKDRLFTAVFEMIAGQMFRKFGPVFDEQMSFEEKIRFFIREHISFLQKNPKLPVFLLSEFHRNPEKISKIIHNLDLNKFWSVLENQHRDELDQYNITRENIPQFMTTVAGMTVFPFAARPVIAGLMGKMGYDFDTYLEERKEWAADFVIKALKK
ncbi:MAG TPA: TetR/AcrR family transcriptional regulator [Bacteroidales bacterium]|nr:TetR/AcrR family transcriptional regulator [Bacteroidales bacterium]HPF02627.1 TetR/AcrR family transcriptional regulator [Bacteroidales bacterium]HPJ59085.1 TetR/AcrR family transcriptional regulator [Bacteroidales bacterium]HPR11384.1 TetR/AcrR family transcriptional regulator [Bacteroidales bacterium]HRW85665.1 TetR/AcrR family transcriptional regulator [Bacteroidales bacterium]